MTDAEHKQKFLEKLHLFKIERREDIEPPSFAKRAVDQFKLWTAVQEGGGHAVVTANKGWARIGRMFDPPKTMTDLSFRIKKTYETNLLPFEKAVLDGTVTDVYIPPRTAATPPSSGPAKARQPKPAKRAATGAASGGTKRARQDTTDEMVGKRIRVLWPDERQFFSGTVTSYNPTTSLHKIDYDDGDEEQLDLATQTWHLLTDAGAGAGDALHLVDNGGLGQLHSAAEALANANGGSGARDGTANQASAADTGCIIQGKGFKVYETHDPDGFEIFCLIPGLQIEEIRVQCWDSGKLLVTRDPKQTQASSAWGVEPLKHKIRLPKPVHARSARALVTLHGQLYIKVFREAPPEQQTEAAAAAGEQAATAQPEPKPDEQQAVQQAGDSAAPEVASAQTAAAVPAIAPAPTPAPDVAAVETAAAGDDTAVPAAAAPAVEDTGAPEAATAAAVANAAQLPLPAVADPAPGEEVVAEAPRASQAVPGAPEATNAAPAHAEL